MNGSLQSRTMESHVAHSALEVIAAKQAVASLAVHKTMVSLRARSALPSGTCLLLYVILGKSMPARMCVASPVASALSKASA